GLAVYFPASGSPRDEIVVWKLHLTRGALMLQNSTPLFVKEPLYIVSVSSVRSVFSLLSFVLIGGNSWIPLLPFLCVSVSLAQRVVSSVSFVDSFTFTFPIRPTGGGPGAAGRTGRRTRRSSRRRSPGRERTAQTPAN